jgi:hypothetical protein
VKFGGGVKMFRFIFRKACRYTMDFSFSSKNKGNVFPNSPNPLPWINVPSSSTPTHVNRSRANYQRGKVGAPSHLTVGIANGKYK